MPIFTEIDKAISTGIEAQIEPEVQDRQFLLTKGGDIYFIEEDNMTYYLLLDEQKRKTGQNRIFQVIIPQPEETHVLATTSLSIPDFEVDNLKKIKAKAKRQLDQNSKYIHLDIEKAKNQIEQLAIQIAKIYFSDIAIELTPFNDIKFKLKFDENKILIITHVFSAEDLSDYKVAYSFFINKERIISDVSPISNVAEAFINYLAI